MVSESYWLFKNGISFLLFFVSQDIGYSSDGEIFSAIPPQLGETFCLFHSFKVFTYFDKVFLSPAGKDISFFCIFSWVCYRF
jgi:hypothetical protein